MGLSFILAGCNDPDANVAAKNSPKSWQLPLSQAKIVKIPLTYSSTGSVVTDQRIDIASPTTGLIRKILIPNGMKVTKGQVLVILQSTDKKQRNIRITSPVNGVVVTRHKQVGDVATSRNAILTVNINQGLIFETYVTESQIGKIKVNEKVSVHIDALAASSAGTVARVATSGDPLTRRYRVKIILPEQEGLFPGMFGRSRFHIGSEQVIVIPSNALLERGGLQGCFVVDEENKAHFRWLRIGKKWPGQVEVRAGLQGGERIVAVTESRLREGDLISAEESVDG